MTDTAKSAEGAAPAIAPAAQDLSARNPSDEKSSGPGASGPGGADQGSSGPKAQFGILPDAGLARLADEGIIAAAPALEPDQIQPASLDLRLGAVAYRLRASFLPGPGATVEELLPDLTMHRVDLTDGAVLETGCVYLVPLCERLKLPAGFSGIANPKSSTGRLDVFTRLITDFTTGFDRVDDGYKGPLYAEISPRTFSILVRTGSRLNQLRLRQGRGDMSEAGLRALHDRERLVDVDAVIGQGGLMLSVDLAGHGQDEILGFRAKRHSGLIDVDRPDAYDPYEFWEPLTARSGCRMVLDPDEFYILASAESVHIPPDHAAEMVPFDPLMGEFRVHYAGFFDPGFGNQDLGGAGSRAVLEVRSREVPFLLEHGQVIGRLVYEPMIGRPDRLYGTDIGSHYQSQRLKLSKHFKRL